MKKDLTWRIIKLLHVLYCERLSKAKPYALEHPYILHLCSFRDVYIQGNTIHVNDSFTKLYEEEHIENYNNYLQFLSVHELVRPFWNFSEDDILLLRLVDQFKNEIIKAQQTRRQISSYYFKTSKYLEGHPAVSNAVLQLLGWSKYPEDEKDNQYLISVTRNHPSAILLCENIDKLKAPSKFQQANIELWYAGGRNIAKLKNIRREDIPIFYVCDWDKDGLETYQSIRRDHIPKLILIYPANWREVAKSIDDTEHGSVWKSPFDYTFFKKEEIELINYLRTSHFWIEEESNNLAQVVEYIENALTEIL